MQGTYPSPPSLSMKTFCFLPAAVLAAGVAFGAASCDRPSLLSNSQGATAGSSPRSIGAPIVSRDAARLAAAGIDSLLAGKTPSVATQHFFSAYDNTAHTYTRNPDCFAAGIDLTCVSVANSANADGTGGNRGCVTLITPSHGVTNHHFGQPYQVGVIHYFVDRSNTVYARKVVKTAQAGAEDIEVVTFDSPLPAAIRPAPLFPAGTMARTLPAGTPLLATNQQKQAVVTELAGMMGLELAVRPALANNRRPWTASPPAVLGDSDSPTFAVIGPRALLLFTYHTNISGPALSENLPAIKALLDGEALDLATVE